jgi:uncharacterized RDD family membrane protein YckC
VNGSPPSSDAQVPVRETAVEPARAWKDEVAASVRAHRARNSRIAPAQQPKLPGLEEASAADAIAARVAERYARLPSWRETLTAQAAAQSTVDSLVAAANVPSDEQIETQPVSAASAPLASSPQESASEPWQPDLLRYSVSLDSLPAPRSAPPEARTAVHASDRTPESYGADSFDNAVVEPSRMLPATLLTTPRELVAPRKARPRLAEGPLLESGLPALVVAEQEPVADSPADRSSQRTRRSEPAAPVSEPQPPPAAPSWHSIHLDTETPIRQPRPSAPLDEGTALHAAPLEDRAMAALVDCALALCAFLLFSLVFALSSTHLPHGRIAVVGACAILFAMGLLYQLLFFSLTDATPGMRYAKIALCTFDDENPSRSAIRGRIAALVLSALPLGLGFLWAFFDEDSLGWHDRITRTYQRSYRDR